MDHYLLFKHLHITCAVISFVGFFIRGIGKLRHAAFMEARWIKIAPHIVDTLLLLSAIALVMITQQYPGEAAWINAKIAALIVYIGLGMVVIKAKVSDRTRLIAWLAALATFVYLLAVAKAHNPLPFVG